MIMSLWMKSYSVTFQMKATEQYFSLIPFTYYALKGDSNSSVGGCICDHINWSNLEVLSYGTVYKVLQGGSIWLPSLVENSLLWPTESYLVLPTFGTRCIMLHMWRL